MSYRISASFSIPPITDNAKICLTYSFPVSTFDSDNFHPSGNPKAEWTYGFVRDHNAKTSQFVMWARHQILVKYTELDGVQEKTYYIGQYESMDEFPISYSPDFYSRQYYINDTFQNDSQEWITMPRNRTRDQKIYHKDCITAYVVWALTPNFVTANNWVALFAPEPQIYDNFVFNLTSETVGFHRKTPKFSNQKNLIYWPYMSSINGVNGDRCFAINYSDIDPVYISDAKNLWNWHSLTEYAKKVTINKENKPLKIGKKSKV